MGRVVWITGVSGAGKSALARATVARVRACGRPAILLDGDTLREALAPALQACGHDRQARLGLARTYARLCGMLADQGATVVIATISLFAEVHRWNRENLPGYLEIYLDPSREDLRRRDPKNIYARADLGELRDVAGLDLAVDLPEAPHIRIADPFSVPVDETAEMLVSRILEDGGSSGGC